MLQQQQQPNGIGRPMSATIPASQNVPQIRNQVNISQQQRLPGASNTRLSPQQMLQVQAAQAAQVRVLQAQAQAQAQAAQNAVGNMNGLGPSMNNPHLSPPYNNRATTSSPMPHSSPSHSSATLSNTPRPPSAQPQGSMGPAPQVPGNAMPRQPGSMGHFFPMLPNMPNMQSMSGANFTQEQMEHAIRLQSLVQVMLVADYLLVNAEVSTGSTGWNATRTEWFISFSILILVIISFYMLWICTPLIYVFYHDVIAFCLTQVAHLCRPLSAHLTKMSSGATVQVGDEPCGHFARSNLVHRMNHGNRGNKRVFYCCSLGP